MSYALNHVSDTVRLSLALSEAADRVQGIAGRLQSLPLATMDFLLYTGIVSTMGCHPFSSLHSSLLLFRIFLSLAPFAS